MSEQTRFDVVTGAFSFTGRFIARRLLALERRVKTLTNHPKRAGAEDITADVAPLQFTDRDALVESLRGADVLYNTYWVRFRHGRVRFGDAVANTRILMGAARDAGVRKVVHISVSNPSEDSGLPIFGIPGRGDYRLQPVAGEDVAEIATWAAEQVDNVTVDAAGPDIIYYSEMVESIAIAVGKHPRFIYMSPRNTVRAANLIGWFVKDVTLNEPELQGLMQELLVSRERPRGTRRLDNWLLSSAPTIGMNYASELDRHWR